jgi:hypothetical protein
MATLISGEWDVRLWSVNTKSLNDALKQTSFTKQQVAQIKTARRRAKNRMYARTYREKKGVHSDEPEPESETTYARTSRDKKFHSDEATSCTA